MVPAIQRIPMSKAVIESTLSLRRRNEIITSTTVAKNAAPIAFGMSW